MKIILTTSPRAEGDLERGGLPFLGIGYIGSWLEKYGYEVKIIDSHTFNWNIDKSICCKFNFRRFLKHQYAIIVFTHKSSPYNAQFTKPPSRLSAFRCSDFT